MRLIIRGSPDFPPSYRAQRIFPRGRKLHASLLLKSESPDLSVIKVVVCVLKAA